MLASPDSRAPGSGNYLSPTRRRVGLRFYDLSRPRFVSTLNRNVRDRPILMKAICFILRALEERARINCESTFRRSRLENIIKGRIVCCLSGARRHPIGQLTIRAGNYFLYASFHSQFAQNCFLSNPQHTYLFTPSKTIDEGLTSKLSSSSHLILSI